MEQFVTYLIHNIITDTKDVIITKSDTSEETRFKIKLPIKEYGVLIGKGGKTISAIRSLVNLYSYKHQEQKKVQLHVEDNQ